MCDVAHFGAEMKVIINIEIDVDDAKIVGDVYSDIYETCHDAMLTFWANFKAEFHFVDDTNFKIDYDIK